MTLHDKTPGVRPGACECDATCKQCRCNNHTKIPSQNQPLNDHLARVRAAMERFYNSRGGRV